MDNDLPLQKIQFCLWQAVRLVYTQFTIIPDAWPFRDPNWNVSMEFLPMSLLFNSTGHYFWLPNPMSLLKALLSFSTFELQLSPQFSSLSAFSFLIYKHLKENGNTECGSYHFRLPFFLESWTFKTSIAWIALWCFQNIVSFTFTFVQPFLFWWEHDWEASNCVMARNKQIWS